MLQSMRSAAKYIWIVLIVAFVGSFLLYETSGLAGRSPVTTTTAIATVNGEDILLTSWQNAVNALEQQQQQQLGRGLTLDERKTLEDRAYDELVTELLLQQEFTRRGISVTDDEILEAARLAPPPQAMQSPDLQTDGQFDIAKYQRLLASPMARQSGMLAGLEAYYRSEIPKQKLFDQVASDARSPRARSLKTSRSANPATAAPAPVGDRSARAGVADSRPTSRPRCMPSSPASCRSRCSPLSGGISFVSIRRRATRSTFGTFWCPSGRAILVPHERTAVPTHSQARPEAKAIRKPLTKRRRPSACHRPRWWYSKMSPCRTPADMCRVSVRGPFLE